MPLFNVIKDTREQTGWAFTRSKNIGNVISKKLDTGDYSIEGLEDKICIERKASTSEISGNMFEKRFQRELERMVAFEYRFIVVEFYIDNVINFPSRSGIPQSKWKYLKVTSGSLMKFLCEIEVKYKIPIIYAGTPQNSEFVVDSLLKRIWEDIKWQK